MIKCLAQVRSASDESRSSDRINLPVMGSTCNSYTMGCPPVRGDNPRALASGLPYEQVDTHIRTILYLLHKCRHCISRNISC